MTDSAWPRSALVTGATGVIGPTLVTQLVARGWRVSAVARHPPAAGLLPHAVDMHCCDILDTAALVRVLRTNDVIFHLAARVHDRGRIDPSAHHRANVDGTASVMEAASRAHARRVVFFSTIGVYGSSGGQSPFTEVSDVAPASPYAISKAGAERLVLAAQHQPGGPESVVLRVASVFGPRMRGNYVALLAAIERGRFVGLGRGQNRRTLVYVDDVVQAAIAAATLERANGRTYNVTDGRVHAMVDIVAAIAVALGRTPPRWRPALGVLNGGAALAADVCRRLGVPVPVVFDSVRTFFDDVAVSGDRLAQELGVVSTTSLTDGWRRVVQARTRP